VSQTILLGLLAAGGILMIAVGLARTPSSSAADMVQERLQAIGLEALLNHLGRVGRGLHPHADEEQAAPSPRHHPEEDQGDVNG